jgi:hypothetical protein
MESVINRRLIPPPPNPPASPTPPKPKENPSSKPRHLVSVANAKPKAERWPYENAHNLINLKMGVDSVEALTVEQIPKAMMLVEKILEG